MLVVEVLLRAAPWSGSRRPAPAHGAAAPAAPAHPSAPAARPLVKVRMRGPPIVSVFASRRRIGSAAETKKRAESIRALSRAALYFGPCRWLPRLAGDSLVSAAAASERTNGLASLAAASCSAGPGHGRVGVNLAQRPRRPLADDRRRVVLQRGHQRARRRSRRGTSPASSPPRRARRRRRRRAAATTALPSRRPAIDCRACIAATCTTPSFADSAAVSGATTAGREIRPERRAPCAPAPRSRTPGSTAPPTAPGSTRRSGTRPARPPRCARRSSRAAPAGSASATRTVRATPRRASHQAATCRMPWSLLSTSGITMSTQDDADQMLCALELRLDGVGRSRRDGQLDGLRARPPAGDRGSGRRQRDAQERDDCEFHCLVRVHVDVSVTGSPSQRCSGSRGRRTAHPCRC